MTEVEANNFFFPENLVSRMNSLTGSSPYLSSQSDIKMLNDSSFERNKKNVENYTKIESSRLINIYGSDIYLYLRNIEQNLPSKSFLSKHKINPNVRTKMIDWMIEVFDAYCSETQTFFICVVLVSRLFISLNTILTLFKLKCNSYFLFSYKHLYIYFSIFRTIYYSYTCVIKITI